MLLLWVSRGGERSGLWELVCKEHRQCHRLQQMKFQMDLNKTTAVMRAIKPQNMYPEGF